MPYVFSHRTTGGETLHLLREMNSQGEPHDCPEVLFRDKFSDYGAVGPAECGSASELKQLASVGQGTGEEEEGNLDMEVHKSLAESRAVLHRVRQHWSQQRVLP